MKTVLAVLTLAAAAGAANATVYTWEMASGTSPSSIGSYNNDGGSIQRMFASYDTVGKQFVWDVTYSNQVTKGFWLAISPGASPSTSKSNQVALIYVDLKNSSKEVTVYGYNGVNGGTSWKDGNGQSSGNQTAQKIRNDIATTSLATVAQTDSSGKRRVVLTLNASAIQAFSPLYGNSNEWTGVSFAQKIGIKFHSFTTFDATYGSDGYITSLSTDCEGYFETTNRNTIPTPGAAALAGLAGLVAARRRRTA